jgi:hypothetical protein
VLPLLGGPENHIIGFIFLLTSDRRKCSLQSICNILAIDNTGLNTDRVADN